MNGSALREPELRAMAARDVARLERSRQRLRVSKRPTIVVQ
jgi:hypothetical protein